MRLWHKDLITLLPRQQLLGQWRECCLIAKSLAENGTPNHILVNKVLDYPEAQFNVYTQAVYNEMLRRGYKCDWDRFAKWRINKNYEWDLKDIFADWHDFRYLRQCYYNLEEKYDCGGISWEEFKMIREYYIYKENLFEDTISRKLDEYIESADSEDKHALEVLREIYIR